MTTRVDADDLTSTRSERFLAVILLIFLLIGTVWFYVKVAAWVGEAHTPEPTMAQQRILDAQGPAWQAVEETENKLESARTDFDVAKADADLGPSSGPLGAELTTAYEMAQVQLKAAQSAHSAAEREAQRADRAAQAVQEELATTGPTAGQRWAVAGIRFAFIAGWLIGALALLSRTQKTRPRYTPLALAGVGTGAIGALIFAVDYLTDYIDPLDLGPLVLSALGAVATVATFVAVQRWLAGRLPGRRVRRGECAYCGYPIRAEAPHCEGCGRAVLADCGSCQARRRIGSPHCAACGAS